MEKSLVQVWAIWVSCPHCNTSLLPDDRLVNYIDDEEQVFLPGAIIQCPKCEKVSEFPEQVTRNLEKQQFDHGPYPAETPNFMVKTWETRIYEAVYRLPAESEDDAWSKVLDGYPPDSYEPVALIDFSVDEVEEIKKGE